MGAPLVRELLAAGASVRAASHEAPGIAYSATLSTVRLDLTEPSTWPRALSRVRRVFLTVPTNGASSNGTVKRFVDSATAAGVDHVVVLSVAGAQQGTRHWDVESDIDAVGVPRTFLRPAVLHQQLADTYGDDVANHDRLRMPVGNGRIAYVDARDVARVAAITLVARSPAPRTSYTLTGHEALSGPDVAALLSRVLGRAIAFEPLARSHDSQPITASSEIVRRGTTDPTLRQLLGRAPTSLSDYLSQHRSRWATPVG